MRIKIRQSRMRVKCQSRFSNLQKDLEQDKGHFSVMVQRKSGILSVNIVPKVNGTKWQRRCVDFRRKPVFRATSSLSRG